jgi:hypothetical protein
VIIAASLTSCSSETDDTATVTPQPLQVAATIDDIQTRLNANGNGFINDDIIYIVDTEDSKVYQYVYGKDENFKSTNPVLLETGEKTLRALYTADSNLPTVTNGTVSVRVADQTSGTKDVLVSKEAKSASATMTQVVFQFKHATSKLVFNLPEGTTSCTISGLYTTGDMSLTDGTFSNLSGNEVSVAMKIDDTKAEGCIIPQATNGFEVKIVCDELDYKTTMPNISVEAGKRYTYTLKIKQELLVGTEEEIAGFQEAEDELNFTTQLTQQ